MNSVTSSSIVPVWRDMLEISMAMMMVVKCSVTCATRCIKMKLPWRNTKELLTTYINETSLIKVYKYMVETFKQSHWIGPIYMRIFFMFWIWLFVVDSSKVQCQFCEKWIHKGTITRHVKHQHQLTSSVGCPYCNSQYKNEASLSNHLRIKHNVFSNKV